jgi:hypothetical protein
VIYDDWGIGVANCIYCAMINKSYCMLQTFIVFDYKFNIRLGLLSIIVFKNPASSFGETNTNPFLPYIMDNLLRELAGAARILFDLDIEVILDNLISRKIIGPILIIKLSLVIRYPVLNQTIPANRKTTKKINKIIIKLMKEKCVNTLYNEMQNPANNTPQIMPPSALLLAD